MIDEMILRKFSKSIFKKLFSGNIKFIKQNELMLSFYDLYVVVCTNDNILYQQITSKKRFLY